MKEKVLVPFAKMRGIMGMFAASEVDAAKRTEG
jgi:hypothetical protein